MRRCWLMTWKIIANCDGGFRWHIPYLVCQLWWIVPITLFSLPWRNVTRWTMPKPWRYVWVLSFYAMVFSFYSGNPHGTLCLFIPSFFIASFHLLFLCGMCYIYIYIYITIITTIDICWGTFKSASRTRPWHSGKQNKPKTNTFAFSWKTKKNKK